MGRVTGNGQPVANADVSIDSLRTRTDSDGRYAIRPGKTAATLVSIRALGFRPDSATVRLTANDTVIVDFVLSSTIQILDSVSVEAQSPIVTAKMQGFEDRRRAGFGFFYTRETLAKSEHSLLSDLLRRSNVKLVMRPSPCGGGYSVATGRGGSTNFSTPACNMRTLMPPACYAPVYLDGVPIWGPGWGPPIDVNQLKVVDLEGVEVYRSVAETPLQFQTFRSPCGVVLFWTRTGRG